MDGTHAEPAKLTCTGPVSRSDLTEGSALAEGVARTGICGQIKVGDAASVQASLEAAAHTRGMGQGLGIVQ